MSGDEDDSVGYRKPPKAHRFGPGRSGNRQGRPRGSKNVRTLVHQIAHEMQIVQEAGQSVAYSTVELLFLTLQRKAMSGSVRAIKLLDQYRAVFTRPDDEAPPTYIILPERDTHEVYERRMKAQIARLEYERKARN